LPTGAVSPNNSYFNGMDAWPDGTLVVKNLNRPPGCTVQGFNAMVQCPLVNLSNSTITAVDSKTLKVLDSVQLPQMIGARVAATHYHGKDYAYVVGISNLYRYNWDGKKLTLDRSWGPVPYLLQGQTTGSACGVMGDWLVCMTNSAPSKVALSVYI
jgi:hypothetical protein